MALAGTGGAGIGGEVEGLGGTASDGSIYLEDTRWRRAAKNLSTAKLTFHFSILRRDSGHCGVGNLFRMPSLDDGYSRRGNHGGEECHQHHDREQVQLDLTGHGQTGAGCGDRARPSLSFQAAAAIGSKNRRSSEATDSGLFSGMKCPDSTVTIRQFGMSAEARIAKDRGTA